MARLINTTAMTVDGVIDVDIPLAAEFGGIRRRIAMRRNGTAAEPEPGPSWPIPDPGND